MELIVGKSDALQHRAYEVANYNHLASGAPDDFQLQRSA
jgi:hypothetical protein